MRTTGIWFFGLGLLLQGPLACGSDSPAQVPSVASAGGGAAHSSGASHSAGTSRGESGSGGLAEPDGAAGSFEGGSGGAGGQPEPVTAGAPGGGDDNLGGGAGAGGTASVDRPPFVCDRSDIALPFATWWVSYCLAKADTRTCSIDFDTCYAATKGFLESGRCTSDDDSSKLADMACAGAALAYACPAPVASDLHCGSEPARPEFVNERCRALDAEFDAAIAACAPG